MHGATAAENMTPCERRRSGRDDVSFCARTFSRVMTFFHEQLFSFFFLSSFLRQILRSFSLSFFPSYVVLPSLPIHSSFLSPDTYF